MHALTRSTDQDQSIKLLVRPRVEFDVDGVLFDFHTPCVAALARDGFNVNIKDLWCHDINVQWPETEERVFQLVSSPQVYSESPPIAKGLDLVATLVTDGFAVGFRTARPSSLYGVTFRRLDEELRKRDVSLHSRSLTCFGSSDAKVAWLIENRPDYIVEDNQNTIEKLLAAKFEKKRVGLIAQKWNRSCNNIERLGFKEIEKRIYSLREATDLILNKILV